MKVLCLLFFSILLVSCASEPKPLEVKVAPALAEYGTYEGRAWTIFQTECKTGECSSIWLHTINLDFNANLKTLNSCRAAAEKGH